MRSHSPGVYLPTTFTVDDHEPVPGATQPVGCDWNAASE